METALFDYELPERLIAQHSVEPRDQSRLMVLDRQTGSIEHKRFFEITDQLQTGDVLVFNNTKVFRARLRAQKEDINGFQAKPRLEVFLLRATEGNKWQVLLRPGKKVQVNDRLLMEDKMIGEVVEKNEDGTVVILFDRSPDEVIEFANEYGEIPIPPYVKTQPESLEQYQTVYAQQTGSVAAPTAGFHFTQSLLDTLKAKGVQCEFVTLHVGIGTFRPVKTDTLEEHQMHSEFVSIDAQTVGRILQAKQEKRRVISVGTTTVRTLEGIAKKFDGHLTAYMGDVNLFIKPGFVFQVIDGLVTNFHLPKSTLLVLVSAFAGREHVMSAYLEAVEQEYRFFSFGDAMFIR